MMATYEQARRMAVSAQADAAMLWELAQNAVTNLSQLSREQAVEWQEFAADAARRAREWRAYADVCELD